MIARQRQNLRRTFAVNEFGSPTEATVKQLTKTEEELLDATSEFASGAAQFGPAPELDEAVLAMQQAVADLQSQDLNGGQLQEERALAALVRARKNLRQMLAMSGGSSASQCRSFDHQQHQKLRPPQDSRQRQEQQVAQIRENLDQLAQQQRQWSDDVRSDSGGAELERDPQLHPSESPGQQSQSSSAASSSSSIMQQQQQALAQARQLQGQMRVSQAASDLSQQRMDAAAAAIQSTLDQLTAGDAKEAAETAASVAEQLDELSQHLAGLNAADFSERLGHAQRLAQQLAERQTDISNSMASAAEGANQGSGRVAPNQQQRAVAGGTEMLADLLAHAAAAAQEENREIREALDEVNAATPPRAIALTMHDAADDFEAQAFPSAAQSADSARRDIDELSTRLRQARQLYAQPRLEELMAAEQAIAELIDVAGQSESSDLLDSRLAEVERQVAALARSDSRLAKALSQSGQESATTGTAAQHQQADATPLAGRAGRRQPPGSETAVPGFGRSPTVMGRGLRDVAKVLQTRIQEVILASVRMDADEAVPPEYRELVERYYRELSEDLR